MEAIDFPEGESSHRVRVPRWTAFLIGLFVALVVYPLMVGVVPWAVSLAAVRFGWTASGPAAWNLLGLILVATGIAGLIWVFAVMLAQIRKLPATVELEGTSRVLVTHGPFALSRNPMFLAGLIEHPRRGCRGGSARRGATLVPEAAPNSFLNLYNHLCYGSGRVKGIRRA